MFQRITLKNFRTHIDTSLDLGAVTLLIGANNAGKSNLLAGINHFSWLAARGRPRQQPSGVDGEVHKRGTERPEHKKLQSADFFPYRHRLEPSDTSMGFSCLWTHKLGKVNYQIELYEHPKFVEHVGCRESIRISTRKPCKTKEMRTGYDEPTDELSLRTKLESEGLQDKEKQLTDQFFRDLAGCYVYQLQPSFLKGKTRGESLAVLPVRIASQLGREGGNLQRILNLVQEREERTFSRFLASLRRFEPSFHGIRYDTRKEKLLWLFDLGRVPARLDEFPADVVSDGLLRAAAIALLSSMRRPPALILLEEIENGISQKNLGRFLGWLRQAAGTESSEDRGYATQFAVTSHSPSVLREFSDKLDDVYYVRLEKRGYKSVVRDLNSSLSAFVDLGTVEGEYEDIDGKRIVKISPERLIELWYSGAIGGEA